MYQRLLFVNPKHCIVDWNGRRRPLGLGLCTARPIENHCDYSPHRKHFLPQDKEGFGSDTSHAEKAVFFFKESRIFHLLGWFFIHKGLLYYFYKMYQRLLFVNSKHYIVDWNGRRRLLGLGLRTARPIENHCDYSTHRKHLRE